MMPLRAALLVDDGGPIGTAIERHLREEQASVRRICVRDDDGADGMGAAVSAAGDSPPDVLCLVTVGWPHDRLAGVERLLTTSTAAMADRGEGAMVAVTSTAALAGDPDPAGDGPVAGAVTALTQALAARHGRRGVRANVVAVDRALAEDARPPGAALPGGGSAEVAGAVVVLASADAAFVTAVVLRVDGGRLARLPHTTGNPPVAIPQEHP